MDHLFSLTDAVLSETIEEVCAEIMSQETAGSKFPAVVKFGTTCLPLLTHLTAAYRLWACVLHEVADDRVEDLRNNYIPSELAFTRYYAQVNRSIDRAAAARRRRWLASGSFTTWDPGG